MKENWLDALVPDLPDGYIARHDERGLRSLPTLSISRTRSGLMKEKSIYTVETVGTQGGRIVRFAVTPTGICQRRKRRTIVVGSGCLS